MREIYLRHRGAAGPLLSRMPPFAYKVNTDALALNVKPKEWFQKGMLT